jgi:hypothetical protein
MLMSDDLETNASGFLEIVLRHFVVDGVELKATVHVGPWLITGTLASPSAYAEALGRYVGAGSFDEANEAAIIQTFVDLANYIPHATRGEKHDILCMRNVVIRSASGEIHRAPWWMTDLSAVDAWALDSD